MELNFHLHIFLLSIVVYCSVYSVTGQAAVSLCYDGNRFQVNQAACPGGIVFKKPFHKPGSKNCLCLDGIFHIRDSEGFRVVSGNPQCINEQDSAPIHHIIPLSHPEDPTGSSTLSLWNHQHLEDNYLHRILLPAQIGRNEIPKYMHMHFSENDKEQTLFETNKLENDADEICMEDIAEFSSTHDLTQIRKNFTCRPNYRGSRTKLFHSKNMKHFDPSIGSCNSCMEHNAQRRYKRNIVSTGEDPFGAGENEDGTWVEGLSLTKQEITDESSGITDKNWEKFLIEDYQLVEYKLRLSAVQVYPLAPTTHKLKLLQISKDIMKRAVGRRIIPPPIFDEAFDFFNYLFYGHGKDTLDMDKFSDIQYALEQCLNGAHELKFILDDETCPKKIKYFEYKPFSPYSNTSVEKIDTEGLVANDRKYCSTDNDPIVEIMWKVVDFTHSYCHEDFGFRLNMHHYYEQEMDKLFLLPEIQERWFRKINPETYQVLLPYSNLVNHIENMDRIVGSTHKGRHYNYWLRKPKMHHQRKRREILANSEPYAEYEIWDGLAYCLKTSEPHGTQMIPNLRELNTYLASRK